MSLETAGTLAFVSIFHVIGGAVMGFTLRGIVDSPTVGNVATRVFMLIWSAGFGCTPLFIGFTEGLLPLAIQIGVLLSAIAVPFFWLDFLREMASERGVVMVAIGGAIIIFGFVMGGFASPTNRFMGGVLCGGVVALAGGALIFGGLRRLFVDSEDEADG